ncbi:MAG: tRNA adenosine deaminase-associated protein [Micropruina sp.]|nr:tRNA adenosine deaminase-associated protein [Micropruina sp.]
MNGTDEDFDVELADRGDDRPGLGDLEEGVVIILSDFDEDDDDDDDLDEDDADEDDAEDDDDYPEDATEDDIDFVIALYREDGQPVALALAAELANDLDELINQLRRIPGDGGAVGLVSIASEFFAVVRVRGRHVQVFLSDVVAANDWPLARDVADFLALEIPDDDEDGGPVGDLDILADSGMSEFDLETLCSDLDADSDALVEKLVKKIKFAPVFKRAVQGSFG